MPDTNSQLSVIASEVADTLDKLRTKERYVNSQNEPARIEYGKVRSRALLLSLRCNRQCSRLFRAAYVACLYCTRLHVCACNRELNRASALRAEG
jgi:hypothetical protein